MSSKAPSKETNRRTAPAAWAVGAAACLVVCLGAAIRAPEQGAHAPAAAAFDDASEDLKRLGFLVGEWKLETWFLGQDGQKIPGEARLSGEYILGGVGVQTRQHSGKSALDYTPPGPAYEAIRVWVYHAPSETITGSSLNTLGNRRELDGTWQGDRLVFTETGNLFNGRAGYNRQVYSDIQEDSFEYRLDIRPVEQEPFIEGVYGYTATRIIP